MPHPNPPPKGGSLEAPSFGGGWGRLFN